jgi:2-amino-4-hydroxy-6-hydroxymethyldihydropteridine diphosphokinase
MTALPADALVIGLGGNIGSDSDIVERFRRAREALAAIGDVRSAALYRTEPIGAPPETRGHFLNTAVRVRCGEGTPVEIIATVLELERLLGRDRRGEPRNGPRVIDLDVLVWGERRVRTPEIELPHPRMLERRFTLLPMIDLFGPAASIAGAALAEWAARVAAQTCEHVAASW